MSGVFVYKDDSCYLFAAFQGEIYIVKVQRIFICRDCDITEKNTIYIEKILIEKKSWGYLKSVWVEPDIRDSVVDYARMWSDKTKIALNRFIFWIGITRSKIYNWRKRYGKVNEHNSWIPRDWWIEEWEKQAIIEFYPCHNGDGYRRITYMMLDAGIVAVSPSMTHVRTSPYYSQSNGKIE